MTDAVAIQIANGAFSLLAGVSATVGAYFIAKLNRDQAVRHQDDVKRSDMVKTALAATADRQEAKIDGLTTMADANHRTGQDVLTRVNGAVGIQLQVAAGALRRLAELSKDPKDREAAELAESGYRQHQEAMKAAQEQAKADSRPGPDAAKEGDVPS